MKFAHMADCHIGSWRDDKLRDLSTEAFSEAIDISVKEDVDFILISGDLFNTAIPALDSLKSVVKKLSDLREKDIPVYIISGSHDYSPSGKTMLDILEEAGLCINVAKTAPSDDKLKLSFTTDKNGCKIVGMIGRRGGLESTYYQQLDRAHLEREEGYKIFMFHSAIDEYKPEHLKTMEAIPLSLLPKGFDYYAGGHVHVMFTKKEEGYGTISFPGPLFPNDFKELETLKHGSFSIVEDGNVRSIPITVYTVESYVFDCKDMTPEQVTKKVLDIVHPKKSIVTLRFKGRLANGSSTDIAWSDILSELYRRGAYFVMKNTSALTSPEFEEIMLENKSSETIEDELIAEHLGQVEMDGISTDEERRLIKELLSFLDDERQDGERVVDFEERMLESLSKWTD